MKLVKFTKPDGIDFWLNPKYIAVVGADPDSANTAIFMVGSHGDSDYWMAGESAELVVDRLSGEGS